MISLTSSYYKMQLLVGAFNITKEAERRSREAQQVVDGTSRHLTESERIRQRTEDLISQRQADFVDQMERNQQNLDSLDSDVSELSGRLADINNMVCLWLGRLCSSFTGYCAWEHLETFQGFVSRRIRGVRMVGWGL